MISKEEAIALLDEYLELAYNVDPWNKIYKPQKASRSSISENVYCWMIYDTNPGIGGGPYFIDKETADIYGTGSAPHVPHEEDFIYFKEHGQSLLDWIPLKNLYLEAKVKTTAVNLPNSHQLKAKYETREKETKNFIVEHFKQFEDESRSLEIRYKPIDGIDCFILVNSIQGKINSEISEKSEQGAKSISLPFKGGFNQFTTTLMGLKKWIRINKKTQGNDAWITVIENDWTKDFKDWALVAHQSFS